MRLHRLLITLSLAPLATTAPAMAIVNGRQRSERRVHRNRCFANTLRDVSFAHVVSFAQPPRRSRNELGCASGGEAVPISGSEWPRMASEQSSASAMDYCTRDCTDLQVSTSHHRSACAKRTRQRRRIQYVPWAGKRGMLPHQSYSGVLDYEEIGRWLRMPLDGYGSILHATAGNYFSSLENSTSTETNEIKPQGVQPRHLKPIYIDDHIIVVNKPSGVLSVPGPRRHECVASLAYRYFGKSILDLEESRICDENDNRATTHATIPNEACQQWQPLTAGDNKRIDTMVVHRLDRDTSGVLMFARNDNALKRLHNDFKDKTRRRASKRYVGLVCGHWNGSQTSHDGIGGIAIDEGEINLPLVRDIDRPPFMRVATTETTLRQEQLKQQSQTQVEDQRHMHDAKMGQKNEGQRRRHPGYIRMVGKEAKASLTTYRILSYEYLVDDNDCEGETSTRLHPVTRVELTPVTGRTHQLRVHCAAVGHPIVGDSIYGYGGEGSPRGGLESDGATPGADMELQRLIHDCWMRRHNSATHGDGGDGENEDCMLCLHAHRLAVFHPVTESPMMFDCAPPF